MPPETSAARWSTRITARSQSPAIRRRRRRRSGGRIQLQQSINNPTTTVIDLEFSEPLDPATVDFSQCLRSEFGQRARPGHAVAEIRQPGRAVHTELAIPADTLAEQLLLRVLHERSARPAGRVGRGQQLLLLHERHRRHDQPGGECDRAVDGRDRRRRKRIDPGRLQRSGQPCLGDVGHGLGVGGRRSRWARR